MALKSLLRFIYSITAITNRKSTSLFRETIIFIIQFNLLVIIKKFKVKKIPFDSNLRPYQICV